MIVANMATYPARRDGLGQAVRALAPQLDRLNLVLNQYDAPISDLTDLPNVNQILPSEDTKDAGKFYPDTTGADWVLYVDGDIDFPADYVTQTMLLMGEIANDNTFGSYHGTIYRPPKFSLRPRQLKRWWRYRPKLITRYREVLHFSKEVGSATIVDEIGSGVAVARQGLAPPYAFMRDSKKFVDVRLSRWCYEKRIQTVCLPHAQGWLGARGFAENIYDTFTLSCPSEVAKEIWMYATLRADVGTTVDGAKIS